MLLQLLFALTASAHYPYENEMNRLHPNLGSNLEVKDIIEKSIVFKGRSQTYNVSHITDSFIYDPIIVNFYIYQSSLENEKMDIFDAQNLDTQLELTFSQNSSEGYMEIGNRIFTVPQYNFNRRELTVSIDPSLEFYSLRTWYNTTDKIEDLKDDENAFIDIEIQLKITSAGWGYLEPLHLFLEGELFTSRTNYLQPDDLHHPISGYLESFPRYFVMNNSVWLDHRKIYVPISLSLTSGIFENLLKTHNYTSSPTFDLFIRLRIIENQFEIDENPPDIRIYHNQKKFVSNRTSDFIDYHLDITPGIEQILEFDLYNYGYSTYFFIYSMFIEIPPLFVESLPSNWDIFWTSMKENALIIFIFFGLILVIVQNPYMEKLEYHKSPIKSSKKNISRPFVDSSKYNINQDKGDGDKASIIDPGVQKRDLLSKVKAENTEQSNSKVNHIGNWITDSEGYRISLDNYEKIEVIDDLLEKAVNRFLEKSGADYLRSNFHNRDSFSTKNNLDEESSTDIQRHIGINANDENDPANTSEFKSIFPYSHIYEREKSAKEAYELAAHTDDGDQIRYQSPINYKPNHSEIEPSNTRLEQRNNNTDEIDYGHTNPNREIEGKINDEISQKSDSQGPSTNEWNENPIDHELEDAGLEQPDIEFIDPKLDHFEEEEIQTIDHFDEEEIERKRTIQRHPDINDFFWSEDYEIEINNDRAAHEKRIDDFESAKSDVDSFTKYDHVDHEIKRKRDEIDFHHPEVETIIDQGEIKEHFKEGVDQLDDRTIAIPPIEKKVEPEKIKKTERKIAESEPTLPSFGVSDDIITEILEYIAEGVDIDVIYTRTGIDINFISLLFEKMEIAQIMYEIQQEAEFEQYHKEVDVKPHGSKVVSVDAGGSEGIEIDKIEESAEIEGFGEIEKFDPSTNLKELLEPIPVITFTQEILDIEVPLSAAHFKKVVPKAEDVDKYRRSPYIEANTLRGVKGLVKFQDAARMHFFSLVYAARKAQKVVDDMKDNKIKEIPPAWKIFAEFEFGTVHDSISNSLPSQKLHVYEYLGFHSYRTDPEINKKLNYMYQAILRFWNPGNNSFINQNIVGEWIKGNDFNNLYREKILFYPNKDEKNKEAFHLLYNQIIARIASNYFLYSNASNREIHEKIWDYPFLLKYHPRLIYNFRETDDDGTGTDIEISVLYSDDILEIYKKINFQTYRIEIKNLAKLDIEDYRVGGKPITIHKKWSVSLINKLLKIGLPGKKSDYKSLINTKTLNKIPEPVFRNLSRINYSRFINLNNIYRSGKNTNVSSKYLTFMKTEDIGAHFYDRLSRNSVNLGLNKEFNIIRGKFGFNDLFDPSVSKHYAKFRTGFHFKEEKGTTKWDVSFEVKGLQNGQRISIDLINAISIQDPFVGEIYAYHFDNVWKINPDIPPKDLERIIGIARFETFKREYQLIRNQLIELAATGVLVQLNDGQNLTLGSNLESELTLLTGMQNNQISMISQFDEGKHNYLNNTYSLIVPSYEIGGGKHLKSITVKITADTFGKPGATIMPLGGIFGNNSVSSFSLGILSSDIPEWKKLSPKSQHAILSAYSINLWDTDRYYRKTIRSFDKDSELENLNTFTNQRFQTTWMIMINQYKSLINKFTNTPTTDPLKIIYELKINEFQSKYQDSLWELLNEESPELINIMIQDLLARFVGNSPNIGISQSCSIAWNRSLNQSRIMKNKGIKDAFLLAGKSTSKTIRNIKSIINNFKDPRILKGYDTFFIDNEFANKEKLELFEKKRMDKDAYLFANIMEDFKITTLYSPYTSLYLFPDPKGGTDRIQYQSNPSNRYKDLSIKKNRKSLEKLAKTMLIKNENTISKSYNDLVSIYMDVFKPSEYYHSVFPTHGDYNKVTNNGSELKPEHLSLGRIAGVEKTGLSLTSQGNLIIIEVTNPKLLAISLRDFIYVAEAKSVSKYSDLNYKPAHISDPFLWDRWLGKFESRADLTDKNLNLIPVYDETNDPPLRFALEVRENNVKSMNLEQLLIGREMGKHYNMLFLPNRGIHWKNFKTRNLGSARGAWLFYIVKIENAIRMGTKWPSLTAARKSSEFVKEVKIWDKTLFCKKGQGPNSSMVTFQEFEETIISTKEVTSFKNKFEGSNEKYQSLSEYMAFSFNLEVLLKSNRMKVRPGRFGKPKYYYFVDKHKYEKTFLGMNWTIYKLPYRMPYSDTKLLNELKELILSVKDNWKNSDWLKKLIQFSRDRINKHQGWAFNKFISLMESYNKNETADV
ncbi:MAG: hypothetical protein HeimC2_42760 [Candidatus Heimdallarchaeota archaeon LC_2]|nr:MAG: hypothetical protein HeimC2_42760 [Candidatus Heimdallarchaeota archaeon LC_2]